MNVLDADQLAEHGLPDDKAQAIAGAAQGMTLTQWLQLGQAILQAIGGIVTQIGKPPKA